MTSEAPQTQEIPAEYRRSTFGREASGSLLNKLLAKLMPWVPKPWVKPFARRYVAGETLEEMLNCVKQLNAKGIGTTIDLLGEFIHTLAPAYETAAKYKQILDAIAVEKLDANISVKLSAFGLLLDEVVCYELLHDLVAHAAQQGNFVRIDMEDTDCTDKTIQIYLKLRQSFQNVGLVLQAYLRRTHADTERLISCNAAHFRLCKGIYVEPRWLAYQDPQLINQNYLAILDTMLGQGAYVGIATHDERLVWGALQLIKKYKLQPNQYEFQMLLGVDPELRDILVAAGHRVRVYVPFGQQWHAYCMRRLNENPKIVGYLLQNFFQK